MERDKRALITGGAGFLGSHLCERFLDEGYEVVCLDNLLTGNCANIEHLGASDRFQFLAKDVIEDCYVDGPLDLILHFASPASPSDYLQHPIATLKVGAIGTLRALDLAHQKGARFILASTSEVYGDPLMHPQQETYWGNVNPVGPRGVYDEAKRFAEAMTMAYRRTHSVDTGIVRIFNTYGPRMRVDDGRAIPTFVCQALSGLPLTISGDGTQTRSVCYVSDLIEGIFRLAISMEAGPLNIGNPSELSMFSLALRIRGLAESASDIKFIPRPEDDPRVRRPDITEAQRLFNWSPTVSLDEGLRQTIEWFRVALSGRDG